MPALAIVKNGKKFLWDKGPAATESEAQERAEKYRGDGFETLCIGEAESHFVYSRRVVTEIVVEEGGKPS